MIIANIQIFHFTVPLYRNTNNVSRSSGCQQDPLPTSMSSSSLAVNASRNQTSRDSFSTAMTKNAIVLVLAITITIVNCALIQTIRKHQVRLFWLWALLFVCLYVITKERKKKKKRESTSFIYVSYVSLEES